MIASFFITPYNCQRKDICMQNAMENVGKLWLKHDLICKYILVHD